MKDRANLSLTKKEETCHYIITSFTVNSNLVFMVPCISFIYCVFYMFLFPIYIYKFYKSHNCHRIS